MPIDLNTLRRAHSLARDAVEDVVNESFPAVTRLAYGLTGRDDAGDRVVRHIVRRGLKMLPTWHDEGEPQRWFLHHTILACRREGPPGATADDLLITSDPSPSPPYTAFVRAIRALPNQQAEALILHHGESFNLRYVAVAMDCSVQAAQQHLDSGTHTLQLVAGNEFASLLARVREAYRRLSPAERVRVPVVSGMVGRHVWPRRLWRWAKLLLALAILGAITWVAWKIVPNIEY